MGVKIKMTQNVCGSEGFPAQSQRASVRSLTILILLKVLEMCVMGALSVTPFTEKLCEVAQKCVERGGGYIRGESPHNMGLSKFSFSSMLLHFIAETPPPPWVGLAQRQVIMYPALAKIYGLVS